jgi:hypothetical protein
MRKQLLAAVGGGSVLAGGWLVRRYRHDVAAARARRAAIDRTVIETSLTAGDGAAVTLDRLDLASRRSSACSTISLGEGYVPAGSALSARLAIARSIATPYVASIRPNGSDSSLMACGE